jgi:carbon-monoxide dehydrogenase medium subunit
MLTYHRPASLPEACRLLGELGDEALPLAGGTDLVPDLRRGARSPRHLVSLRDLVELRGILLEEGRLRIGALSTPAEIAAAAPVRSARPELLDAIEAFATPQVRNRATIGGNLCTAAACGDLPPLLLALRATAVVAGAKGRREIPLDGFFRNVRSTSLLPGEILVAVLVRAREPGEGARYEAFGMRAAAFITVAGVAAAVRMEGEICRDARVVLSAVAPTPLPVPAAGEGLTGRPLDDAAIGEAARATREAALPITDVRGSAEHRRDLVEVLTVRALRAARERAHEDAG